jgi:hypothetical protein
VAEEELQRHAQASLRAGHDSHLRRRHALRLCYCLSQLR